MDNNYNNNNDTGYDSVPMEREGASETELSRRNLLMGTAGVAGAAVAASSMVASTAQAHETHSHKKKSSGGKRPNILVLWGDDIGWQNTSAYGMGTMGYTTPNIDRIGHEGVIFTDHYAQPSCTAGRASFITGQYPIRSGMVTVGQPGDKLGLKQESPCLAQVMKDQGYATGHFGKSHLGDRNEHLPTNHGFDEFFGNLYHLNVSEEDEQRDYQNFAKNFEGGAEDYAKQFGARGIIHSFATDEDDDTEDPRFGKVGKQKIEDTGPLTQDRMRTVDEKEVMPRAMKFMEESHNDDKPFFIWLNPTRMHVYVRLDDKWRYAAEDYTTEADLHGSGMMKHDHTVGQLLDFLDESGLADDTLIWYSTDNGPEHSSWPHGGTTPFRGEKMTTYEGGVRVLSMVRWPGQIKPGTILNGIQCHQDMFTTLAAIAGAENVHEDMLKEKKQILDGVDNRDYWTGKSDKSERTHIIHYFESQITAFRINQWKWHFATKEDYYDNMTPRNYALVFNIHMDPFESYDSIDSYGHLLQKVSWMLNPMKKVLGQHLQTLIDYPPVQGGKSFDMAHLVEKALNRGRE